MTNISEESRVVKEHAAAQRQKMEEKVQRQALMVMGFNARKTLAPITDSEEKKSGEKNEVTRGPDISLRTPHSIRLV